MVVMAMVTASEWGTWEELLLAGAVIRHGSGDWDVIAGELRSRSLYPENFTPQICKAKYEDLRQCYNGCKAWFEELKRKRMEELRAALQKSEDSIESLESKLQNLKAEQDDECYNDYDSDRTVSVERCQKFEGTECTSKDTSKDLSSAGSYTQQALTTNWSSEIKLETSLMKQDDENFHVENVYCCPVLPTMRKRRGKRKRKDVKELSAFESDVLDSSTDTAIVSRNKQVSTRNFGLNSQTRGHDRLLPDELMKIFYRISRNDCASVFRRRLDSQKRGRYKKLVRRHMDFDTIQSRITNRSISSAKELFHDLLLLANNAALFYSKNTREHKSAVSLRGIVTKSLKQYLMEEKKITKSKISTVPSKQTSSVRKPRTTHLPKTRFGKTTPVPQDVIKTASGGKRTFGTDSPPSMKPVAMAKQGFSVATRRLEGKQNVKRLEGKHTKQRIDTNASIGRKRDRVR